MAPLRKTTKYLIFTFIVVLIGAACVYAFVLKSTDFFGANLRITLKNSAGAESTSSTITSYTVKTAAENVSGAPSSVSLGFNNAEQVVETKGGTNMVWVTEDKLQLVVREAGGAITSTTTVAEGAIFLPAITRTGDLLGIAWVERTGQSTSVKAVISTDGGVTFSEEVTVGNGSGPTFASSNKKLVLVWHDDTDETATKILLSEYNDGAWSSPTRVDASDAAPLWASVAMEGNNIYVTWRDDRSGSYNIWLRRYIDGAWEDEQNLVTALSGDPDICVKGQNVSIAHHGKGKITLLQSTDGGATFNTGIELGDGYFPHISCSEKVTAVAWEYTTGSSTSSDKQVGWALYNEGSLLGSGTVADENSVAASTVHINTRGTFVELLWIQVGAEALVGTLRHEILALY